ncbi:uncharacterized protein LOC126326078 isoform X2 [Schistocerca gregaria]|nr:uncharacterized protein LOC126326078 isoform X2 [Schistocerca gregaria]
MMTESVMTIAFNSARMTLALNNKVKWIDAAYNGDVLQDAYANLVNEIKRDKKIVCELADAYFSFFSVFKSDFSTSDLAPRVDSAREPPMELLRVREFFERRRDALARHEVLIRLTRKLMPSCYNFEACVSNFWPQLILFYLRFFDVYDEAMKGMSVGERMKMFGKEKSEDRVQESEGRNAAESVLGEKLLKDFGRPAFWERRYQAIDPSFEPHEWYVGWETIEECVLKKTDLSERKEALRVLHLGCGISLLDEELLECEKVRIERIVSIDFVESLIRAREGRVHDPRLEYRCMSVLELGQGFEEGYFDLVVDKGCLDSLLTSSSVVDDLLMACREVSRVMKPGAYFVLVSCAIQYEYALSLQNILELDWAVKCVYDMPADTNEETKIHVIVIRKFGSESERAEFAGDRGV